MVERVCFISGRTFDDEKEGYKFNFEGTWYYFRDISDRNRFLGNPKKYIEEKAAAQS